MRPSSVHSVKATSQRSFGLTQCTARHSPAPMPFVSARVRTGSTDSILCKRVGQFTRAFIVKPVPTFPA